MSSPKDIRAFLVGRDGLWGAQLEPITPENFLLETLMMGLRLEEGIASEAFLRRFGVDFEELFPGVWGSWVSRGEARPRGDRLAMSDSGRMLLDGLLAEMPHPASERPPRVTWP
jgi:coproporphyrinogen III oxidase-like Fe-S oxidoreductase